VTQPTGTVAFLFTDVEGSTRRWERYGEAMRDALRRHDKILRSEIEERRGYIFKTIGDAFCAAFPTVAEALEVAVEAQRRLAREDFRAVDGLAVRMAIDAGETDERDGDYFGTAVNRTARLLSAGHGGQILLSGFAADLALPHLPDGITLRHLGALPLRDLKEPERVYQPVGAELRSGFKALRALETPPNNLPRQTTSFVGRHDDLARVEALLDKTALVTIVGAGGIGKTRLALEVAAGRLNDERDGAWFVDLSAVVDAALIAGTILSATGGEHSADVDPLDDLVAYLAKREMLLVLDNSEHLVSEVAGIVAQIVARCHHVSVLATSRSPLNISSEQIYRLSSLDAASAVRLFGDRARAANPSFRAETKASVVEEICSRLDGIALAIELAAARVGTMSVESLASHLELRLLTGGRDRRPRQQTMRALVDWSYDLLAEDEQRALRRSAVFLRGFTLAVACGVCGDDGDDEWRILDLLASLVDKSLVVLEAQEEDQRYRLLEPIREYAWEKLADTGELPQTRRRHAVAIASLVAAWYDEWDKGPSVDWIARLEKDLSNLRAALRWSVEEANDVELGARLVADATIVFLRLALFIDGIEWCERILKGEFTLASAVDARLRYGLSMLYSNIGANEKCLEAALVAVSRYREVGDARGLARALSQVASRYAPQFRYDEAKPAAEEALALARESGDRRLLADVLRRCAEAFAGDGPDAARARFAEGVALFRSLGRNDDTARALAWWGQWEEKVGNYGAAAERLEEAMRIDERDTAVMFHANDVASAYLAIGDLARAEAFARKSLVSATKVRHDILASLAISYLAVVASESDARKAARLIGHAQERLRAAGWKLLPPDDAIIEGLYGVLKRQLEEAELARLFQEGAAWSEDQAVVRALAL
jgi:predicted ATPase/class 3 adenylate cyclase